MDGHPLYGSLSPVIHPINPNLHRVPVRKTGRSYILYVGDNTTRLLEEDNLPDEVKIKMTMILATSQVDRRDHEVHYSLAVYVPPDSGELNEVGWQASDTLYCLCLSGETLDRLIGKSF